MGGGVGGRDERTCAHFRVRASATNEMNKTGCTHEIGTYVRIDAIRKIARLCWARVRLEWDPGYVPG